MLIYPTSDPRHFDRRLHKGGDGGAGQMRADEEERQRKVQMAVDTVNAQFGNGSMAQPTREQFTTTERAAFSPQLPGNEFDDTSRGQSVGLFNETSSFDAAGFAQAMKNWQDSQGAAERRQAMYTDIQNATRDVATRDLDKQFTQASNQNLFGLARSGLLGGSVDAEAGADLATRYGEGQIRATAAGQGAAADLRSVDEKTRQNLISLAQSGMDTGTAASMAAGQMAAAADSARSTSQAATVGRLFDDMGQAYLTNQQLKARYPATGTQGSGTPGYSSNLFAGNSYGGTVRK
ncbi:hypothetical protein [Hydrogenophaga sp. 2FB]|uniref:hypothetical protein n=1 Tax=Hydrogenophaga sp. 2FB TaxID=2502187 RepID=UPI0010FA3FC9|nr:hypothetical protein [Hydrogenophaga sp. 2FB]